jgi:hypothetical protein
MTTSEAGFPSPAGGTPRKACDGSVLCRRLQIGTEEGRVEPLPNRVVGRRQQVPVAVESDLHARVPGLLGDQLRVLALSDQQARKRVPQIMEADLR